MRQRVQKERELRKAQDDQAAKGNATMLILLGKNELDQSDKKDQNINATVEIKPTLTIDEMKQRLKDLESAGKGLVTD